MPNVTSEIVYSLNYDNPNGVKLNHIVIKKEAREIFKFTYQVTVVSDTEETIIT
ncbi:hypothetical protein KHQ81_12205 [Mycoplasmatota bacterium]|nr:hypothetical protein KHQ81_12205 [Mycoplasmatota bacterium]